MKTHFYTQHILDICDNEHYSVEDIFLHIQNIFPEAGKSSIYRNVESLVANGSLKKIVWIGSKAYFEKTKPEHIHLIDNATWAIYDIDKKDLQFTGLPDNFCIDRLDIKIFGQFN